MRRLTHHQSVAGQRRQRERRRGSALGGSVTESSCRVQDGGGGDASLVFVVDEVTAQAVRTEPGRVERPTHLRLVFRMTDQRAQFGGAVRELALVSVAARPVFLELTTQLGLVTSRVHHHHCRTL